MALPNGFKRVGMELPPSVIAIVKAAGGENNFPKAMASILGAVPWIAAALYDASPEDYKHFAKAMSQNWEAVRQIVEADNPREAFNAELQRSLDAVERDRRTDAAQKGH